MVFKLSFIFKSYLGFRFYNTTPLMLKKNIKEEGASSSDSALILPGDGKVFHPTNLIPYFGVKYLDFNLLNCDFCNLFYCDEDYDCYIIENYTESESSTWRHVYEYDPRYLLYHLNRRFNILGIYFFWKDSSVFYENNFKYYTLRNNPSSIKVYTLDVYNKDLFALALNDGTHILDYYFYPNSFNGYSSSGLEDIKYIEIDPRHILVRDESAELLQKKLEKGLVANTGFRVLNGDPKIWIKTTSLLNTWRFNAPQSSLVKCSFWSEYKCISSNWKHGVEYRFKHVTLNEHIKGDLIPHLLHLLNKRFNYIGYYFIYDEEDLNYFNSHKLYTLEGSNLIKVFKVSDWNIRAFLLGLRMGFYDLDCDKYRVHNPNWGEDPSLGVVRYLSVPTDRVLVRDHVGTYHSIRLRRAMAFLWHNNPIFYMSWETF